MKLKTIEAITLDWKEFSQEALESFRQSLKKFGLYLGDVLEDYYRYPEGEGNGTDTYCLYIARRKLTPNELKKEFSMLFPDDEQETLFDMNEFRDHG